MSKPELTKHLIADTLKKLVLRMPIDKISVNDIVEACGINRTTFYYHFQDKQALITWIFNNDFAIYNHGSDNGKLLVNLVDHMFNHKTFYLPALLSEVQNNLKSHLFKVAHERCMIEISELLENRLLSEGTQVFVANYFANAVVGCIIQWAQDGMKIKPSALEMDIAPLTADCLRMVIDKYAK